MISTTFDNVVVKGQFVCNGTHWVKRSKEQPPCLVNPIDGFTSVTKTK